MGGWGGVEGKALRRVKQCISYVNCSAARSLSPQPFIDFDTLLRRTTARSASSFDLPDDMNVGKKKRW